MDLRILCLSSILYALNCDTIQFYFPVLGFGLCGENKLAKSVPAVCLTGPFLSYSCFEFSKGWGSEFIKIT